MEIEHPRDSTGHVHRYEALDSLRGICACLVVLFHFVSSGFIWNSPFVQGGWMFVDFFFVLSGFVISASYGARLRSGYPIGKFMLLRFGRIYPLHFAVLMGFVALELAAVFVPSLRGGEPFTHAKSIPSLIHNLLLIQTFGLDGENTWNVPAWSIAVEFWTYLFTALIFAFAKRAFWPAVVAMIVLSVVRLAFTPQYLNHTWELAIFRCWYGFGLGIVAFALLPRLRAELSRLSYRIMTGIEALAVTAVVVLVSVVNHSVWTLAAPPLFVVAVLIFALERGAISQVLLSPGPRLLGLLSYSIYMVHGFLLGRIFDVLDLIQPRLGFSIVGEIDHHQAIVTNSLLADACTIGFLPLAIAVASVTYWLIELPAREFSRKVAKRMGSASQTPVRAADENGERLPL